MTREGNFALRSSRQRLGIVGASARAAAMSARLAGWDVLAMDFFGDADLQEIANWTECQSLENQLADWCAWPRVDAWLYVGGMENAPLVVEALSRLAPLAGCSGPTLVRCRDPLVLQELSQQEGYLFPETHLDSEAESPDECDPDASRRARQWLRKTYQSGGGLGTSWSTESHSQPGCRGFLQKFVPGVSHSAIFVASDESTELVGMTRQLVGESWVGAAPFHYCGSIAAPQLEADVEREMIRLGSCLAESLQLVGLFGIDVIVNDQGVWLLEVNPRYTASVEVIEATSGRALVSDHLHACGWAVAPTDEMRRSTDGAGKVILFARQPLTVNGSELLQINEMLQSVADRQSIDSISIEMRDVPRDGTEIPKSAPVCTLLVRSSDRSRVEPLLREVAQRGEEILYG